MEISWLGHSCFRIKGKQTTVITDPYSPELGYTLGKHSARIVTVSHQHPGIPMFRVSEVSRGRLSDRASMRLAAS